MDPQEDPPPSSSSFLEEERASAGTPTQSLRNKVTYYEKVWSSGQKRPADGEDETDQGSSFAIDVHAFEKRLKEERDRKSHEQSPRIDVRLRSTPQSLPRQNVQPTNITVNIRHHVEPGSSGPTRDTYEERVERVIEGGEVKGHSRVLKFEKIVVKKSVREVNVTSTSTTSSPVVRTVEFSEGFRHTPSDERIAEDSAYHSHRSRIVSSTSSKSSSSTSLHGNFTSEENVFARRTPSRERLIDSEQHSWSSGVSTGAVAGSFGGSSVSSVADSNPVARRHLVTERHGSESEAASPDWYNEYRAQSFHTVGSRMDFKRSNSQYDSHIKQIRGTYSCFFFLNR